MTPKRLLSLLLFFSAPVIATAHTDSLLFFSPSPTEGMRLAVKSTEGQWEELGQLFSSDYGRWGSEKKMYSPCVTALADGGYACVFSVNDYAPCFAVTYSEDMLVWRPQDYPEMTVKGCLQPVVKYDDSGSYNILFKTREGFVRSVSVSDDFRRFSKDKSTQLSEYDAAIPNRKSVTINGRRVSGNAFATDKATIEKAKRYFTQIAENDLQSKESLADDKTRFAPLSPTVHATLTIDGNKQKAISDKLIGIFFEDISYAADGGLYAEMVQNRDFEYSPADRKEWTASSAWTSSKGSMEISSQDGLSENNPHYAIMSKETLTNTGWDGMVIKKGEKYDFSFFTKSLNGKGNSFIINLKDEDKTIAQAQIKTNGKDKEWHCYHATLTATATSQKAVLTLSAEKKNKTGVDMVSLFPFDTFCGHKNGLRKDLAQTLSDLHPKFVRFPGGCMSHGDGIDNIYHWSDTIGPLQDRKPDRNIWGYHQTRGLGFYEYFQFCEDIGAEPLPVLAAGVPCQNSRANADGYGGQQGGISMEDLPAYIEELCNMIEWANGDASISKWAKMRADAGHPEPFGLKYIGIGNEDIISTTFEERCLAICEAIKQRYPDINICGTVGPFHYPSSDYIEGWKFANEHRQLFDLVDEHYYESAGWFLNNQHYYDNYDRSAPKVYLGEWAVREGKGGLGCALVEAAYLCNIERNADIVAMTSYAPLLSKDGHSNWSPDLIYFDNSSVRTTPSYETQRLFSIHGGDIYIDTSVQGLDDTTQNRVAASVVRDSKTGRTCLKVANVLPRKLSLTLSLKNLPIKTQSLHYEGFRGFVEDSTVLKESGEYPIRQDAELTLELPAYSFRVIEL